jgi:hypothetical protein
MTTGSKNTLVGCYNGNQGGLDIRTASNNIVLSDGDGNPRGYWDGSNWYFGNASGDANIYLNAASGNSSKIVFEGTSGGTIIGDGAIIVRAGNSASGVQLTSGATSWSTFSDLRLKNVTGAYTNALADIVQIEPVKFTWKSDESKKPCVGVIAQSVQKVIPEAINEDKDGLLSVRYTELIPLMIASIQELKAEVDSLKQQLGK